MTPSLLTMGGIAAIVASGWGQVKNIFGYLSSFILVKAAYDEATTYSLTFYLREHWQLLPSGLQVYRSTNCDFRDGTNNTVAWRLPALKAVYRQGWKFLFLSGTKDRMKIMHLRWNVNLDELVKKVVATVDARSRRVKEELFINRYWVEDVVGEGYHAKGRRNDYDTESPSGGTIQPNGAGEADVEFNTTRDIPLNYALSDFNGDTQIDPFDSLYYDDTVMHYIAQAKKWVDMRDWYTKRNLMWRRGWLLYGGPGTGKSSLARATAQAMNIPIYRYHISTLTDTEFMRKWERMSTPCVVLMEDFDSVFHGRENVTKDKLLSFDTVLNTISGVTSRSGIFLMVTTNDLSKIDPAMGVSWGEEGSRTGISTRPGRIDNVIHVGNMNERGRRKLAGRILIGYEEEIDGLVAEGADVSPVQFEEMCKQRALELMEEEHFGSDTKTFLQTIQEDIATRQPDFVKETVEH